MIKAYPKIWDIDSKYAQGILDTEVEITEKLDGSQFGFMWTGEGELVVRSKGTLIDMEQVPKLFKATVDHLKSVNIAVITYFRDITFYGEALYSTRHNTLTYDRVPKGNLVLFAGYANTIHEWLPYKSLSRCAKLLGVEVVPLMFKGKLGSTEELSQYVGLESYLGGAKAEGIVVKAYKDVTIAGITYPVHAAKVVTSEFKEKHKSNPEYQPKKDKVQALFDQYNTEARFRKAVQKLKDSGDYTGDLKDIGSCLKLLSQDLEEECQEDLKDELYKLFRKDFLKAGIRGFPEWFKTQGGCKYERKD